jgi:4-diphosphocytidyl-2-C-methyl-D-erythritol kinase
MLIRRDSSLRGTSGYVIPETAGSRAVHVLAPAKINLYLEVLGKRPDGYHDIETLILALELFDGITLGADDSGNVSLACDVPELSTGSDNLVLKAAQLLKERTGCRQGAKVWLAKRIPWAAGLGGGSSDAAATLAGLNELWELGLSTERLLSIGQEVGSDVPFFFRTPAAFCTGRGEVVRPVAPGKVFDIVLVKPPFGISTAQVYSECGPRSAEFGTGVSSSAIDALVEGDIEKLARSLHNRLQEPAMRICPPVDRIFRRMQTLGAAGCLMTGSGSCLFALCHDDREARQVAHDLLSGWPPDDELARTRVFHVRSCS